MSVCWKTANRTRGVSNPLGRKPPNIGAVPKTEGLHLLDITRGVFYTEKNTSVVGFFRRISFTHPGGANVFSKKIFFGPQQMGVKGKSTHPRGESHPRLREPHLNKGPFLGPPQKVFPLGHHKSGVAPHGRWGFPLLGEV